MSDVVDMLSWLTAEPDYEKFPPHVSEVSSTTAKVKSNAGSWDVTLYANEKTPEPLSRKTLDIEGLKNLLLQHEVRDSKSGMSVSFHSLKEGTKRAKGNVVSVSAFVIDCDNGTHFDNVKVFLREFTYFAYSTHNNTSGKPKWRVVILLATAVTGEMWGAAWSAINSALFAAINDKSTCDASRLFYLPSCSSANKDHAWAVFNEGKLLDADDYVKDVPKVSMASAHAAPARLNTNIGVLGELPRAPSISSVTSVCGFMADAEASGCAGDYGSWVPALSVARHCENPEIAAEVVSKNDPSYSREATLKKINTLTGAPPKCSTINSPHCVTCKRDQAARNQGEATTPIHLAQKRMSRSHAVASAGEALAMTEADAKTREINKEFFISHEGGETGIFRETINPNSKTREVKEISRGGFALKYANQLVKTAYGNGVKHITADRVWVSSPDRREYREMGFYFGTVPDGCYNLWNGFTVPPSNASSKKILRHLWECAGRNRTHFRYLLCWMAFCVQHPGKRTETVVVMQGGEGVGKGTIARLLTALFGSHALHISNSKHLTSNFNAHLRTALFLFVDEGYWAGDKAAEGVLKQLITENQITIERKGVDAFMAENRLSIMMASNNEWVVPVGSDSRRFFVINVPASMAKDWGYWSALNEWLDGGGLSAFLGFLQRIKLDEFNIRAIPVTRALESQREFSLPPFLKWLQEKLYTGEIVAGMTWNGSASCASVAGNYADYCKSRGLHREMVDQKSVGKKLKAVFPDMTRRRLSESNRPYAWSFPDLETARKQYSKHVGINVEWED